MTATGPYPEPAESSCDKSCSHEGDREVYCRPTSDVTKDSSLLRRYAMSFIIHFWTFRRIVASSSFGPSNPRILFIKRHASRAATLESYVIFGEKFCLCLQRTFWGQRVVRHCGIHLPEHKASALHSSLSSHTTFDYMIITTHKFVVLTFNI